MPAAKPTILLGSACPSGVTFGPATWEEGIWRVNLESRMPRQQKQCRPCQQRSSSGALFRVSTRQRKGGYTVSCSSNCIAGAIHLESHLPASGNRLPLLILIRFPELEVSCSLQKVTYPLRIFYSRQFNKDTATWLKL